MTMHPIVESAHADEYYGPFIWEDTDLVEHFVALSGEVRRLVPECAGMSISLRDHGVTITLVADSLRTAVLDAVQYVDGGPCTDALRDAHLVDAQGRLSVEEQWQLFAEATRNNGVESTLSLPVIRERHAALGFNLYGSTATAFDGHHEALADLLGAWANGAVVDADLSFRTRELARSASAVLKEATELAVVAGLLSRSRGIAVGEAERRLRDAAERAAVPLSHLLTTMHEVLVEQPGGRTSGGATEHGQIVTDP